MKKKFLLFLLLLVSIIPLSACGKTSINLNDYLIEERNHLFTANDEMYNITLSTGMREKDYNFDGIVGEKVEFGVLTFARLDNAPLSNDQYNYVVQINEETLSGNLEKNPTNNSYVVDLEMSVPIDATIAVQINFTGYTFKQTLTNSSNDFAVDSENALKIANKELQDNLVNLTQNNTKIEVVMKILKDNSNVELNHYFWYIGVISTNGDTLGILIDANTSEIIAKKV